MNSLNKLRPLQNRCQINQIRCETRMRQYEQKISEVDKKIHGLQAEIKAIHQLLQTQKIKNSILNRANLFAVLRKQAVLRRQIHILDIQVVELNEKRQGLEKEQEAARMERAFWMHKYDKYQFWIDRYRYKLRLMQLSFEENEIQEVTTWTI